MHTRTLLFLGWACLLSTPLAGQDISPQAPPPGNGHVSKAKAEVHYISRESLGKGVTLAELSSGMNVIVQEDHSAPLATVRCYVRNTGSAFEGADNGAGLSHVLEHLVAGGTTTRRTEAQIREILDSLGGQTNAYTSNDITAFYIDCPGPSASVAIELVAQEMQSAVIPENEYQREMGVVQRELEMGEATRSRVLYNAMKQLMFTIHPIRHPTIGYLAVVQQIKRDEVIAFYKNRYVPQNMVFVVVGDVETTDVLDNVLAGFKNFHRTTERSVVQPIEPEQIAPRTRRIAMEGPTVHFSVAWPTVPLQDPELYPLDVASFVLTNGDSSRLARRLKIDEPLAISVNSFSNTPGFVKGWFQVTVECKPENYEKARAIVFEEIERLKTEPIASAELAKAKRQKAAEHVFSQQSVQNRAEMLSQSFRSTGDPLFDNRYVDEIQTVTAEQIQAAAKRYFQPQRLNSVIIEPLETKRGPSAEDEVDEAESPIVKRTLPNGLTVLLKRQSALPLVTIQAYARAGASADTEATSGLASLTTEMMEKGTDKYTADQIAEFFDSIGGTLSLSSQQNTSYLQVAVLKDDAQQALGYIDQILFHPTFGEAEFNVVKQIRLARLAARKANPQTEIIDFWSKQLPASTVYSRTALGDPASVSRLTAEDCRKFHKKYIVPNNMVVAVFGDIDVEAMYKQVAALFGEARKSELDWPKYAPQDPVPADIVKHLQNQKKNTAMVLMSYPTISVHDEHQRAVLDVLDAVLTGGGGAGGRLHEELRGQQLVYYIFGIQMIGPAPGYFVFLAQTRPESILEVETRIRANLDKIRDEGVPTDDFAKAKGKLITAHAMRNTTPSERAFQSSIDELYGLGYDYEKSYAERIRKVTVEDLKATVKKYFAHGVIVTTSPEKAPQAKAARAAQE